MKDEGYIKLQQVVDTSHHVLPNTAARGKDQIRTDIQKLQVCFFAYFKSMRIMEFRKGEKQTPLSLCVATFCIHVMYKVVQCWHLTCNGPLSSPKFQSYLWQSIYIVTCQAHPVLVKKANQMCGLFLLKNFIQVIIHLWTDQRIPGPVSCRCPNGLLETPPRWQATICIWNLQAIWQFLSVLWFNNTSSHFTFFNKYLLYFWKVFPNVIFRCKL